MAIKGNKGEWSEFYAFLKILTDGKMFTADKDLELLKNNFHIVLKIIREENCGKKFYDISKDDGNVFVSDETGELKDIVELKSIKSGVNGIFDAMKTAEGSTFRISLAENAMKVLHCSQIKASSGRKADLMIVLHDRRSPAFPELGFSIKSMLGSPSTLLNASGATNFVYKISGSESASKSQSESEFGFSVRDESAHIYRTGQHLEFLGMDSEGFRGNLRKIDSNFPEIMAEILKRYYSGGGSKISDLVDRISEDAEFCARLDLDKSDFVFKVKRFLSDVALGMTPKKEWDGHAKAHGGYIIVKENGEIVCYHIYNRDQFEEYLYSNTRLDTPSTTRHKFGHIYKENGERRIKFNLQIRFVK